MNDNNKSVVHFTQTSDLHPYECGGNCIHCTMTKNEIKDKIKRTQNRRKATNEKQNNHRKFGI